MENYSMATIINPFCSLWTRDQVSHPYITSKTHCLTYLPSNSLPWNSTGTSMFTENKIKETS
jgi:hypothetical protein